MTFFLKTLLHVLKERFQKTSQTKKNPYEDLEEKISLTDFKKLNGLKIVYVNTQISFDVLEWILKGWGIEVKKTHSTRNAIELISTKSYHALITHLIMPEIEGVEAAKIIRSKEDDYFKQLTITGLSGKDPQPTELETGINYIVKLPVNKRNISEFHQILSKIQI